MTRITWGDAGSRLFESGVDRGVLFPPNGAAGVPWNGLTSVKEAPSGGAPIPYYLDGIKYLQVSEAEEFNASIEAFSSPPEFAVCDGTANIYTGLFITQQPRKQFDFSYRTLIGNDIDGPSHGYKIHLVYNAMAKPVVRTNKSLSGTSEANLFSWDISTVPIAIDGFKPSAHIIIDSTITLPDSLVAIENILYGTYLVAPRLPLPSEVITIIENAILTIIVNPDGSYSAEGVAVTNVDAYTFAIDDPTVVEYSDGTFAVL